MYPTIAEYNQVIQIKGGSAFRSLSNLSFIPSRTIPFIIYSYGSGSYAVVFKAKENCNEYAIRCFISAEQENIDRYRNIDNYLKGVSASWVTKIELLENEINISGNYYPIIKMDWVEGQLLNNYINEILHLNNSLMRLQEEVVRVSESLETYKIGHGDIQCGNIIISKDITGKGIIKLIDYDGMYIPSFSSNKVSLERGRAEFQHPNRSTLQFNEKIDRFSFWVILCALEALKYDKSLWLEVMKGGFNTLDNLLFTGDDFRSFGNSKLVNQLYSLKRPSLSYYLDKLNQFCNSSSASVEPPLIFNSFVPEDENIPMQTPVQDYESKIQIISFPIGATVLTSTLQPIGITPLSLEKSKYLNKTLIISFENQTKQIEILEHPSIIGVSFSDSTDITNSTADIGYSNGKMQPVNQLLNVSNADGISSGNGTSSLTSKFIPFYCPKCSTEVSIGMKFCQTCGCNLELGLLKNPTCPKCKTAYPTNTKFCIADGSRLALP